MSDTKCDDDTYLIWSNEHRGWWQSGGYGYSRALPKAGHYTRAQALQICCDAIPQAAHIGMISEVPVRLLDVIAFLKDPLPAAITKEPWEQ